MEIAPTTHYVMGGVRVDADTGASTVPGLFAAGEVAGGMHGANRLGGNSLSDLLVFGQRAGLGAAAFAADRPEPYVDPTQVRRAERELDEPFTTTDGADPYRLREELQATMQSRVGIFRVEADLDEALERLGDIRRRAARIRVSGPRAYNPGWNLVFELRNLIDVSEAITRSARQRTESRGAHSRLDFPDTDAKWGSLNSVVCREADGMRVTTAPTPPIPEDLLELAKAGGSA
jgi:succinate dehydrogenase / fumarate reductase flavoprotein subunit